jgi:hypothetical protein
MGRVNTEKICSEKIITVERIFDEKSNKTMQQVMEDIVKIIMQNEA